MGEPSHRSFNISRNHPTAPPEYLPESTPLIFRKAFIWGHQHFLTQTNSYPNTYYQIKASNLQTGRTQMIATPRTAPELQHKREGNHF